ncbi:MAG: hypothetical protein ACP5RG_02850 [Thermoplasmata archaeon]
MLTDTNSSCNNVKKKSREDNSKLSVFIKLTSVEFGYDYGGYIAIDNNIYLDSIPYLIFFIKVSLNPDLKEALKWARKLVLNMLDKEINKFITLNSLRNSKETDQKLKLLQESKRKIKDMVVSFDD